MLFRSVGIMFACVCWYSLYVSHRELCVCAGIHCALSQSELYLCVCVCAGIGCAQCHSHSCVCVCVCAGMEGALSHSLLCVCVCVHAGIGCAFRDEAGL